MFSSPNSTTDQKISPNICNKKYLQKLFTAWILCTVLIFCGLFTLIGRNFKNLLIIGVLCSANENNIAIDLNRFQVVSRVVKKV